MAAAAALPTILALAGTGVSAIGAIQQGRAQQAALNFEAQQREKAALEERAASQREMIEKREEGQRLMSRQRAVAAASGAGVVNPTILDVFGDTAAAAEFNAQTAKFGGEQRARGQIDQARLARAKGKAAFQGSVFEGIGTALSGAGKAFG